MQKLRIAIIGYGNIGKYAVEAVNSAQDMEIAGIVRRNTQNEIPIELTGITITDNIENLGHVDVAIICTPTRSVMENAKKILQLGINTVDSFDIHSSIWDLKHELEKTAKENEAVSIISAGWDPGSDSIVRALLNACAPKGITYTNFGPGMSMGHTVAAKAIEGVEGALSMTIPLGTGVHRRMVYVQIKDNANFEKISSDIKSDSYFANDETYVIQVKDINDVIDKGHGVNMIRKGVSGETDNQLFEFSMKINNPALTSQILVSCARASMKQKSGCYTMIEIPIIDMLYGTKEDLIKKLV